MGLVKIIYSSQFDEFFKERKSGAVKGSEETDVLVKEIIEAVRTEGDAAVRRYSERYEKSVPGNFEVPPGAAEDAWKKMIDSEPLLASSFSLAYDNIRHFAELQKEQLKDFEAEITPGIYAGQLVIPVEKAAIYVPGGRFPLISSALMGLVPAAAAGVGEKLLVSPPGPDGLPDWRILAAAHLAGADRIFALGGAQAIAALALGTETIPRVDLIAGPGNKYVAEAKRLLFGEVGIDFIAGPTDVLVVSDSWRGVHTPSLQGGVVDFSEADGNMEGMEKAAEIIAADMLAQAEHDPDASARALLPDMEMAELIEKALEKRLAALPTRAIAQASLERGGLLIVYKTKEEAIIIANKISPEHLELHVSSPREWIPGLRNFGSLFIGPLSAEVLGDYSAGINHTLPTSSSARFTGGLSVRNFLKTVTTLRCESSQNYIQALNAAQAIARAEGLAGHAESAALRTLPRIY